MAKDLPTKKKNNFPSFLDSNPIPTAEDPDKNSQPSSDDKPILLIAEDNKDNYLLLNYMLKADFSLLHASNGREAVALFKIYRPHLLLMDIRMPEMNGYEALTEIRKISNRVPVIAVTAYAYPQDIKGILAYGFDDYITKPIDSILLKQKIEKYLKPVL